MSSQPIPSQSQPRKPRTRREPPPGAPLSESEFCRRYGFARGTVRKWRGDGAPYIQVGMVVRIEPERLLAWLRARSAQPEQEVSREVG